MKKVKATVVVPVKNTWATVKGQKIKAMYNVNDITNRTNKNLWVAFEAGKESEGLVFSMVLDRNTVRNTMSKITGTNINNIRSKRVSNWRKTINA